MLTSPTINLLINVVVIYMIYLHTNMFYELFKFLFVKYIYAERISVFQDLLNHCFKSI